LAREVAIHALRFDDEIIASLGVRDQIAQMRLIDGIDVFAQRAPLLRRTNQRRLSFRFAFAFPSILAFIVRVNPARAHHDHTPFRLTFPPTHTSLHFTPHRVVESILSHLHRRPVRRRSRRRRPASSSRRRFPRPCVRIEVDRVVNHTRSHARTPTSHRSSITHDPRPHARIHSLIHPPSISRSVVVVWIARRWRESPSIIDAPRSVATRTSRDAQRVRVTPRDRRRRHARLRSHVTRRSLALGRHPSFVGRRPPSRATVIGYRMGLSSRVGGCVYV